MLLLAHRFLTRFGTQFGKATEGLSPSASERLMSYDWPGNVRELRNCMERAVALATATTAGVGDALVCAQQPPSPPPRRALR